MTLLQVALDAPEAFAIVPQIRDCVDVIEIGTPLLKRFGLSALTTVRQLAPGVPVLADAKTVDAGALEAELFFAAGAAIMTVLSVAAPATLAAVDEIAARHGGQIVVDTITEETLDTVAERTFPPRVAYVSVHVPTDARLAGAASTTELTHRIRQLRKADLAVSAAGGISRDTIDEVAAAGPAIIVIGAAITTAPDPRKEALWLRQRLAG